MRSTVLFLLVFLNLTSIKSQEIQIVDFNGLQPILNLRNDTTYVVNFWATWCIPCVKELPFFQKLHDDYQGRNVRVVLVSLDFKKDMDTRLKPFIQKNKLSPKVIMLYDSDGNSWINKVSPDWSGALPATLVYNRNFRSFYEKSFSYEELQTIVNQNLIEK
jgi:thiol-disulfide isomerase/thioredoxin